MRSAGSPARGAPVTVRGDGLIETFAWETQAGLAVHVLNYTNPAAYRGWLRDFHPIGAQQVRVALPPNRRVSRVELLRAEKDVPFRVADGAVTFTIPARSGLRGGRDSCIISRTVPRAEGEGVKG